MIQTLTFVAVTALMFTALYFYGEKERYKHKYNQLKKESSLTTERPSLDDGEVAIYVGNLSQVSFEPYNSTSPNTENLNNIR